MSTDNARIPVLKGVEPSLVKRIMDEVLEETPSIKWEDIAGQEVNICKYSIHIIHKQLLKMIFKDNMHFNFFFCIFR